MRSLAGCCLLVVHLVSAPASWAQTPAPIQQGIQVGIVDVLQVPLSSPVKPLARLNLLYHAGDGSGRLFVNDMRGRIFVIVNGQLLPQPFLDVAQVLGAAFLDDGTTLSPATVSFEMGLGSFAFHPDFARQGRPGFGCFYTVTSETKSSGPADFHSSRPDGFVHHHEVLREWRVCDPLVDNEVDVSVPSRVVLRLAQPLQDHNIGLIAFNPNARRPQHRDYGNLYIAVGDGGNTWNNPLAEVGHLPVVDEDRNGQNTLNPFGSILRIDPRGHTGPNNQYGIPGDNPFCGDPQVLDEIWAYGFRNPQRFSWDSRQGRKMFCGDIGQKLREEINLVVPGGNYGWSEREGTRVVDHMDQLNDFGEDTSPPLLYPVAQYGRSEGSAIVGGFVYRGQSIPQLRGKYVFGDLTRGRIFYVRRSALRLGRQAQIRELRLMHQGTEKTLLEILGNDVRADLRFGQDEDGEIYVLTKRDGFVRKLVRP